MSLLFSWEAIIFQNIIVWNDKNTENKISGCNTTDHNNPKFKINKSNSTDNNNLDCNITEYNIPDYSFLVFVKKNIGSQNMLYIALSP